MAKDELLNKVAQSGLVTLDIEKLLLDCEWQYLDIKPFLFREMVLMEKNFRETLKNLDWSEYTGKWVGLYCSSEALIPHWAYMLLTSYLLDNNANAFFASGEKEADKKVLLQYLIQDIDVTKYKDARVVVKGCGKLELDASFYLQLTQRLLPEVKSLMYGEPCSTVPIFKRK